MPTFSINLFVINWVYKEVCVASAVLPDCCTKDVCAKANVVPKPPPPTTTSPWFCMLPYDPPNRLEFLAPNSIWLFSPFNILLKLLPFVIFCCPFSIVFLVPYSVVPPLTLLCILLNFLSKVESYLKAVQVPVAEL